MNYIVKALDMGFKPLAYLNIKGYFNPNPKLEDMQYWAKQNGISLASVTSFTDGTKIQFEQALAANGLNAHFAKPGMIGLAESNFDAVAEYFGKKAKEFGAPLSDYIIFPGAPHGVLVIAEHENNLKDMLRYVKMGNGPYYILKQDAILIHLEVPRTIDALLNHKKVLLTNSKTPKINVAALAKRPLQKGEIIKQTIGSFDVRGLGINIADNPNALPIGLMQNARIIREVAPDQILSFDDVELPESLAVKAWQEILKQVNKSKVAEQV